MLPDDIYYATCSVMTPPTPMPPGDTSCTRGVIELSMHNNNRCDDAILSIINLTIDTELSIVMTVGETNQQDYLCHCNTVH